MTRADDQATHSGFAQFPDRAARDRFVRSMLDPDSALKARAFLPETRPTIVFENLTLAQRDQVRSALHGQGQWFDDVQFRTL
jgi:hypothetical protein